MTREREAGPAAASPQRGTRNGGRNAPPPIPPPELDDFTYADPADSRLRRLTIRGIERLSGKPRLIRLYREHLRDADPDFWGSAVRRLGISLDYDRDRLAAVPDHGPLLVVANHPYGVLDGLMIGHLIGQRRPDFRIMAHGILTRSREAAQFLLPVDFADNDAARRTNLRSRREAVSWLKGGGALIVFPGGTVSTAPRAFGPAVDPPWRPFTARLVQTAAAPVLPVCFVGQNSRLFQLASHVSLTLRLSLLFHEVANKIGTRQRIEIGTPIAPAELAAWRDREALTAELRRRVYALHPTPQLANRAFRLRVA